MALSAAAGACRITREYLPEGTASVDELEVVRKKVRRILEPMVDAFPKSKHPAHAWARQRCSAHWRVWRARCCASPGARTRGS